jgi:hypothetical protein
MGVLQQVYLKARGVRVPLFVHFDLLPRSYQRGPHCYLPKPRYHSQTWESAPNSKEINKIPKQMAAAGGLWRSCRAGEAFLPGSIPGGGVAGIRGLARAVWLEKFG